ncbi:portal protein, partial [Listeria monocytogenes]|uniref:portal protein n=1 Tax=Listeria monocytogenes TaxID=1639 RepID=UPI002FDBB18D
ETMWHRIYQPGTNFTTALHEVYLDLGSFGTSVMYVGQRDDGGLLFEPRALAECVIAENSEGRVDTVFRKTKYTVRQM